MEARNKERMLTTELEDLDRDSIESDRTWLQDLEENAWKVLREIEDYLQSHANDAPSALSDNDIRSVHSKESCVRSEKIRHQQENEVSSFKRTQAYVKSLSAHPLPSATWRGERGVPAHNLARIQVPTLEGNPDKWPYF